MNIFYYNKYCVFDPITECTNWSFDRSGRRGKTSSIWKSRPTSAKPTWSTAHSARTVDSATGPVTDSTAAASCAAVAAITQPSANYPKTATANSSGVVELCATNARAWSSSIFATEYSSGGVIY